MTKRYEQFLGNEPGMIVELVDDSTTPYTVKSMTGFEFCISAEDFKNYYKKEGSKTPARWSHLVTDPETGRVESEKMATVMKIVHSFDHAFRDFDKSRAFVRDALHALGEARSMDVERLRVALREKGWDSEGVRTEELKNLMKEPESIRRLLLSQTCAVVPIIQAAGSVDGDDFTATERGHRPKKIAAEGGADKTPRKKKTPAPRKGSMKNVELSVEKEMLTITVDLAKDFGPSKSGKTTIVASTVGNKIVPGREERIGMNIYRQETKKPAKGRRAEFKNVRMSVDGDILTITVDLSLEFGPSRSGRTTIVASTEGNQLVFDRSEKIGLNVYRKIE